MSSFYESRHSYPFYTESGDYDKFTESVNDLTVWVDTDAVLPIRVVSCSPTVNGIRVVLSDYTDTFTYIMDSSTGYIHTPAGVLAGLVSWNPNIVEDIKATLEAQTPSPQDTVFVLPSLCHIRHRMPMSVVSVNGNLSAYGMTINIIDKDNVKLGTEQNAPVAFNLYQYNKDLEDSVITAVVISRTYNPKDTSEGAAEKVEHYVLNGINGSIWLRPDAECDIRVLTEGDITISAISEG